MDEDGVVDDPGQRTESACQRGRGGEDRRAVGRIGSERHRLAACRLDRLRGRPRQIRVDVEDADGGAARDFTERVNVGMVGVNFAIPVPLSYYTFGGWKRSGFGDLNQHGPDAFRFYTKTKTVTSRWPSGVKEGAEFAIPVMR